MYTLHEIREWKCSRLFVSMSPKVKILVWGVILTVIGLLINALFLVGTVPTVDSHVIREFKSKMNEFWNNKTKTMPDCRFGD